jgi:hypothetical protein
VSGEIYHRGEHQRQQEEDSGEVPNRFAALVEAVSVAEVDESPPSPFPEPAGDDWNAFSQTAPHTQTQTLTQVSHLSQLSGPPEVSHLSQLSGPPEDSQRSPSQRTLNQVFREDDLLEQSPGLGIGRITQDQEVT